MKKNGFIFNLISAIKDPERDFDQRVYLALSVVSEAALFIALMGDMLIRENPLEIATIVITLIAAPAVLIICLRRNRLRLAIKISVIGLVFFLLPALYFFGGGAEGGGVLWIIFSFAYAGLVLTGTWRTVILALIILISLVCYMTEYYFPQLVYEHTKKVFLIDSYISIILVGIVCFAMTWLQNWLFMMENERAKRAVEKAEELSRSQNRFFSSMSHEIRTPINSILGLNELILRDQSASDEIVRDASGIQGSGKMLLALINDILDFSKMEAGSMDIVPVEYRIGDLLSEIVNMVWLKAKDKGLKLDVSIDPNVPSVLYGDEVRVKQIIINLLNNAVKYTQEGAVELHVESEEKNENTVGLTISVSDTGIGIKKEVIPYLFDAFKRVDEEKNRHIEGTGLGLSIVKQLAELMGGNVTVNSVYGEGSTFTVVLDQGITDRTKIGELNIHNQGIVNRSKYESSFRAPEARILIVDDNEMNLEVEIRLLSETEMTIDKALSGKEALELVLKNQYDVILMDHLMPEMDGIECLSRIHNQTGGMNRTTPVIVLTANAGSENRDLYNRSGFDGYLVKPVSGEALENALMRYIPGEKLLLNTTKVMTMREDINASAGYSGKVPVIITSTSMCDLPEPLIKKLRIPILPFLIKTEEGMFKDGVQMGADELIRYMKTGRAAMSSPPDEMAYTEFFASVLRGAHHVIHIAIASSVSEDYKRASQAAESFDNVTVINSECLSSATGILVLIASKLAQMSGSVEDIVEELETVKHRLKCSFVMSTTEYMAKKGLVSPHIDRIVKSLSMHPCLEVKDDKSGLGGIWIGSRRRAYRRYLAKAFPVDVIPDPEVVFITYADVPINTLLWIKEEISKIAYFEKVVFKQASAAISSNCGPGSFGILYFVKSNKSYNLSSYLEGEQLGLDEEIEDEAYEETDYDNEAPENEQISEGSDENSATQNRPDGGGSDNEASESRLSGDGSASEDSRGEGRSPGDGAAAESSRGERRFSGDDSAPESSRALGAGKTEPTKWYENIKGIDPEEAIKNSGSEESFKEVLRIFYESMESKSEELKKYFAKEDWKNYTIRVHALKSSCKLIGALETSEKARLLEMAGHEERADYIREHHQEFLDEYLGYRDELFNVLHGDDSKCDDENKPVADEFLMESIYEAFRDAANAMDCDAIEAVFKEIEGYAIPENERAKYEAVCEKADQYDYEGMLEILDGH